MKKIKLEDFIKKNRTAFDDKAPSDQVWKRIENAVKPTVSVWNSVMVWRAAAIVFMVLSGYLLLPNKNQYAIAKSDTEVLNDFKDVEKFYVSEISKKVSLINDFSDSDGLNGFTQNFQQLDAMYMVLKEEMKNSPSTKVKEALVLNLLIQIDLLNKQLDKLDTGDNEEGISS